MANYTRNQNPETEEPMARPRTPTTLLELRGGFKNRPSRLRARQYEPLVTTALPDPAPSLPKTVKSAWLEMQSRGFWLTSADRFLVEIAARLMAAYRNDQLKSGDVQARCRLGYGCRAVTTLLATGQQRLLRLAAATGIALSTICVRTPKRLDQVQANSGRPWP